jgi:hypothetical protein
MERIDHKGHKEHKGKEIPVSIVAVLLRLVNPFTTHHSLLTIHFL